MQYLSKYNAHLHSLFERFEDSFYKLSCKIL